jgi:hypothetical protein
VAQLRAGLEARRIELCEARDGRPAGAAASEIMLSVEPGEIVTVALRDAITGKRLAREVPLASVPPDARPLTVALAVDELLRASWVELALGDAPTPARPVPPEIGALIRPATASPVSARRHRWELGAALAAAHFGSGTVLAGVDLGARGAPTPVLSVHVAMGLRAGTTVHAADGDVRSTAFDGDVGIELILPPHARDGRAELAVGADGHLIHARFAGEPHPGSRGGDATATALYLGAGLRGSVHLAPAFGLSLACGFGVPVHAVDVFDGSARVAGLSGSMLSLAVGGWWRWP